MVSLYQIREFTFCPVPPKETGYGTRTGLGEINPDSSEVGWRVFELGNGWRRESS